MAVFRSKPNGQIRPTVAVVITLKSSQIVSMSGMNIAEFRRLAERELLDQGLVKMRVMGFSTAVFAAEPGETIRFFSPQAMRRPWGCQLQGCFGVEVAAIRKWAQERGVVSADLWLIYYMSNERKFISPTPVVGDLDLPPFRTFVEKIHSRVLTLPSSISELVSACGDTRWHLSLLCASNPGFWELFSRWAGEKDVLAATGVSVPPSGNAAIQILSPDEMRQVQQHAFTRFIDERPNEVSRTDMISAELIEPPPPARKV